MTILLDIHLLPVSRYLNRDLFDRTTLHASEPPRRAARSRGSDRLVLYLVMKGDLVLSPDKQKELLVELAQKYYASPGSVTSAMKGVAEDLNHYLLEVNRLASEKGRQGLGLFCQWVIREEQFYLALSGDVQAYWITEQGTQILSAGEMSARGLGLVRSAPVSFSQVRYQPNNTLIISGKSDPVWNQQTLMSLQGQGPEGVRRRLSNLSSSEFDLIIAQARPGKGKIHFLQPRPFVLDEGELPGDEQKKTALPTVPDSREVAEVAESYPQDLPVNELQKLDKSEANAESYLKEEIASQDYTLLEKTSFPGEEELPEIQFLEHNAPGYKKETPTKFGAWLRSFTTGLFTGLRRAIALFSLALGKLIPEDLFRTVPSSVMASMAIIIPLIVVTIASVTYFQLGRSAQYQIYYSQAEQTAIRAIEQDDLLDQRINWIAVKSLLDQAEKYQVTEQTQALRLQAQYALDNVDLVKRVDYQPAIEGGLPAEVSISKMVLSAGDLYLLDSKSGKVLRARPSTQGYSLDSSFECGPTSASVVSVSALIDILAWPAGFEPEASVLGVDRGGNLAFCKPGSPITVIRLALPQSAVGSVKAIDISGNELFVISQGTRAVWAFNQKAYDQPPRDYFTDDQEKPDNLDTTISFVVDRDDLYLLHNDGKITYCSTLDIVGVPVRCRVGDLVDMRPGRENSPMYPATPLGQIIISSPPDPSLFFLEPANHSVYHFSLRSMVFQRHYMPRNQLSILPATAFTIYPERRTLFLAIGRDVYYGTIP